MFSAHTRLLHPPLRTTTRVVVGNYFVGRIFFPVRVPAGSNAGRPVYITIMWYVYILILLLYLPSSVGESTLLLSKPLVTGGGDRFACRCVCVSHSSSWCTNVGCWHVLLVCGIDGRLCAQPAAAADWCWGVVAVAVGVAPPLDRLWSPHDCGQTFADW